MDDLPDIGPWRYRPWSRWQALSFCLRMIAGIFLSHVSCFRVPCLVRDFLALRVSCEFGIASVPGVIRQGPHAVFLFVRAVWVSWRDVIPVRSFRIGFHVTPLSYRGLFFFFLFFSCRVILALLVFSRIRFMIRGERACGTCPSGEVFVLVIPRWISSETGPCLSNGTFASAPHARLGPYVRHRPAGVSCLVSCLGWQDVFLGRCYLSIIPFGPVFGERSEHGHPKTLASRARGVRAA